MSSWFLLEPAPEAAIFSSSFLNIQQLEADPLSPLFLSLLNHSPVTSSNPLSRQHKELAITIEGNLFGTLPCTHPPYPLALLKDELIDHYHYTG